MREPKIPGIISQVEDTISSGQFSICIPNMQTADTFPTDQAGPFCFVVVCMCCGKEKSRDIRENYKKDVISHGLCTPLCEEAKKAGWAKFVRKEYGGEL